MPDCTRFYNLLARVVVGSLFAATVSSAIAVMGVPGDRAWMFGCGILFGYLMGRGRL